MTLLLHPEKHLAMSKNVIHNFNLSIQNSADIKSAEHLTNVFIKELAKVSKEMSQQKDIVQIWQEQQLHNTITNDLNSSTEGGAIDNTAATIEKTALSTGTTPSANGDPIKNNTTSSTVAVGQVKNATSSLPDGGGVTDTNDKTAMRSLTSANTTPPTSEVENDTTNKGITSIAPQPYANVGTQESVRLPQHLKENNLAPTIDEVKKGVQTQLNNAIKNNNTEAIKYWSDVLDKLEKGASIADYKNDPRFNLMYNELKPLGSETATFHWDNIRLKMIAAIESKILNDQISVGSKNYWNTILKELKNEQVNIANLFEQYDELFLLLREVEGLTELPNSITFFTKTKVYPNLSPDKMYANLGAQNVYAFLKELSAKDNIGAGVNKGGVFIKNTSAKTFILGESLEFGLNEKLVNQKKFAKENINWVVYLNNKIEKTFVNEGPNFSYNFEKLGNYIIEAYGEKADAIKDKKHSAYVDINIIKQEIEIIAPTNFSAGYARPFTEAKQFAVKLKANKAAKPKNPLQLFYQIEYKAKDEFVSISEVKPLSENGLFNVSLPKLGTYTVIVTSNGQYPIDGKVKFKTKENYVEKISITKNFKKDNIYLKLEKLQQVEYKATEFLFNPATTEEMNNVKWVLYNEKELQDFNKDNPTPKQPFAKGTKATFNLPLTEGKYWVEAYSNTREGKKSTSSQQIQVVHPTVTEANWTDTSGTPKTTSGFIGEINYVKATVPNFCNEEVRIYFHVKAHKDSAYYKNRYFITTKTDSEGKINTAVSFSKEMKAKLGISNWNVNLKFALVGVVDNQLYAFKGISYPVSNAELKVTTKKEILDLYFEYEGKRLVPTDRVPYNSKTPTKIKMVAHTRNMIGEKLKFTAHALEDDSILENLSESTIKANGIAELSFQKKAPAHLKKNDTETYYAGVEGFSTKHFKDKTLVFQVGAKWQIKSEIIFPLLEKPTNDINSAWGKGNYWGDDDGHNQATFNSYREKKKRKHAGRDLYTEPKAKVVAIADGIVLDTSYFYSGTHQVTVLHKLKDGRKFIARYGELSPKSIKVKKHDKVKQKDILGETGKLVGVTVIKGENIYMLHFEIFSTEFGENLNSPLTNKINGSPFKRRQDLIDSFEILKEGYINTFEKSKSILGSEVLSRDYNEEDAKKALRVIYEKYSKDMAVIIEKMYRLETTHFTSLQYKICGSAGMEATIGKEAPFYGWDPTFFTKFPEHKFLGIKELFENPGMSGKGGNLQIKNKPKRFIVLNSVLAGMEYKVFYIKKYDGNYSRWAGLKKSVQENYRNSLAGVRARIVDSFIKE
ncbi:M23 family metallopeptidase [Flavobacterium polysaccharolyticum]|uniref:M23 family metallopeptidase n=1 Tax=Flavobacterium polysaccharolyticum TaxID=3133148 RepID=A0ABU9NJ40_9FLAO